MQPSEELLRCGIAALDAKYAPLDVDPQYVVPHGFRQPVQIGMRDEMSHSGVVDEDVETPESVRRVGRHFGHLAVVADVALKDRRLDALCPDLLQRRFGVVLRARIVHAYLDAFVRERERYRGAGSGCRSGYKRRAPFEIGHRASPNLDSENGRPPELSTQNVIRLSAPGLSAACGRRRLNGYSSSNVRHSLR